MQITSVQTHVVRLPNETLLRNDSVGGQPPRDYVILELGTDSGISGLGITFFGGPLTKALSVAVDSLASLLVGDDPLRIEAILAKLRSAAGFAGPGGIFTMAVSAIDIALWDIKGKATNQSLWAMIGGCRAHIPTYASGSLPRTMALDTLAKSALDLKEQGFRQVKMQLGLDGVPAHEEARVQLVRECLGVEIALMADVNQRWQVHEAIPIGQRLEPYNLFWLEDVVSHEDYAGQAQIAAALATPLAAGEYCFGLSPLRRLLETRAVDILIIDLVRVGGVTAWLKAAALAEAFNIPVVSHVLPEIHVHLVAGIPNGLTVEYMPWTRAILEPMPQLTDGNLVVPTAPGLGLTINQSALKRYQIV